MSCAGCQLRPATVCQDCVALNIRRYNDKLAFIDHTHLQTVQTVATKLQTRLPSLHESHVRLQNITREIVYTRKLVAERQDELDELRDHLTRRRAALDEAARLFQVTRAERLSLLKAQNKRKRQAWKLIVGTIVTERQRTVRESIALYRLRSGGATHYEIHGLILPPIFFLRDYSVAHVVQAISGCAQLTLYLASCLGIKLPFEVLSCAQESLQVRVRSHAGTLESLSSLADAKSFASALACLVVDVQHLCRSQGVVVSAEEDDIGRLLFALSDNPSTGLYSDDLAFSTSMDKDKRIRDSRAANWNLDHLAARILDDLTTDPFEFLDHQVVQSEASLIDYKASVLI